VIKAVNRSAKGPQIVLSRTDAALLVKLFEQEVPEIYDATVVIKGAVREAGDRAKVAVYSRERDVDPVGACVGMKGTRVQSIIRELRGEKIDIVEWSDDAVAFVTNALSPAKVQRVSIVDDHERVMEVVVEDKQLSLAIGKKGQNVRLAAKLTGWRIDIKSEEEKRREVEAQLEGLEMPGAEIEAGEGEAPVLELPDINDEIVESLRQAGYESADMVAGASVEALMEVPGIDEGTAESVLEAARAQVEAAEQARAEAEAAAAETESGSLGEDDAAVAEANAEASAPEAATTEADETPRTAGGEAAEPETQVASGETKPQGE
jgi:N utilization substance protein A